MSEILVHIVFPFEQGVGIVRLGYLSSFFQSKQCNSKAANILATIESLLLESYILGVSGINPHHSSSVVWLERSDERKFADIVAVRFSGDWSSSQESSAGLG